MKKKAASKPAARKAAAKKPAAKKPDATRAAARPAASRTGPDSGVAAYTPSSPPGIGWPPFRYPPQ
jgi:hypothetical protein